MILSLIGVCRVVGWQVDDVTAHFLGAGSLSLPLAGNKWSTRVCPMQTVEAAVALYDRRRGGRGEKPSR